MILKNKQVILASQSPRRQMLLKGMGINFEVKTADIEETYPNNLYREEIPRYLCQQKANVFEKELTENTILITSDTVVWINEKILEKPKNYEDAVNILQQLSGNAHEVFTAVFIKTLDKTRVFHAESKVYFKNLSAEEIHYYIENHKPYDKAGAYGIQEWIGYVAIDKIEGSFFNVMGLPTRMLYEELKKFE